MESILTSIKMMLGMTEEYTHFDTVIITHINAVLSDMRQFAVGPDENFFIEDKTTTWQQFLEEEYVHPAKTYVYLRVKLIFDPPPNSFVLESYQRQIKELEWRLNVAAESEL